MSLRRRGYFFEADFERDKRLRKEAVGFYDSLVKFVKDHPDKLIKRDDGGFHLFAKNFWRHPKAKRFGVIFLPKQSGANYAIGKSGTLDVIILPVLRGVHDTKYLYNRFSREKVVHELVHFLDPGYDKQTITTARYRKGQESGSADPSVYYNDPGEWNAFWHEGSDNAERMLLNNRDKRRVIEKFFGDGSLRDFIKKASYFWDKNFLEYMNSRTRRKFDKRMAQLWQAHKELLTSR